MAALAIVCAAAYAGVVRCGFINAYDDFTYITNNPVVKAGLTAKGFLWAFAETGKVSGNWHPLTWLSHMLDVELFGLRPASHHITSLLLHIANTVLLFVLFARMTKSNWRSALVAALFALHPLHVESVAWVAERKDVLSTFFMMLSMLAYTRYVESPSVKRYLPVFAAYALGLMSKPMLVSMPILLVLLDVWPLGRLQVTGDRLQKGRDASLASSSLSTSLLEKLPLFALSAGSCVVALIAQRHGEAVARLDLLPVWARLGNAVISYASYLGKTLAPVDLVLPYSHPGTHFSRWEALGSAALLLAISAIAWRLRAKYANLIVGWLWYVLTLVPVIGIVQVGSQGMADRYTYIPLIGVFAAVVWLIPEPASKDRGRARAIAVVSVAVLLALAVGTWRQVRYWRNSVALFSHAVACTSNNGLAELGLGVALATDERYADAIPHLRARLKLAPEDALARFHLAYALMRLDRLDEAIEEYTIGLRHEPGDPQAHYQLAVALHKSGRLREAVKNYRATLQAKPDREDAANALAWILATTSDRTLRDPSEALILARRACERTDYKVPEVVDTLAAAYAGTGDFEKALENAENALKMAEKAGDRALARDVETRVRLYRSGKAYFAER